MPDPDEPAAEPKVTFGPSTHAGQGDVRQAGRDYIHNTYGLTGEALPIPRQLPSRAGKFVNRTAQLTRLDSLFSTEEPTTRAVAVVGTPGVGKTALALQWAHNAQVAYPDGSLYVNLRGYDSASPVDAAEALDGFLRSFDVPPDRIPTHQAGREGLYRALLAERRILVLLDNAASPSQVRPLLPGSGECGVLITSRSRLTGLSLRDGVTTLSLEILSTDESILLLTTLIGNRAADDTDATAVLARLCAYLPLALRIVAERARLQPRIRVADIVTELHASDDRLSLMTLDEDDELASLRGVFSWSYRSLSPERSEMFRFLGLHSGPDISAQAAAALVGIDVPDAQRRLDALLNAHLIESRTPGRYEMHDLLKDYATERATRDIAPDEAIRAIRRELSWYLHAVNAADEILAPQRRHVPLDDTEISGSLPVFTDSNEAIRWLETERQNGVAMVRRAADSGHKDIAWKLPLALNTFFHLRWYLTDWAETAAVGLAAARTIGDPFATAWSLTGLGGSNEERGNWPTALRYYEEALALWRESGDPLGEVLGLTNLIGAYREVGRPDEAIAIGLAALDVAQQIKVDRLIGAVLLELGQTHSAMGNHDAAMTSFTNSLQYVRQAAVRHYEGQTLRMIATLLHDRGQLDDAVAHYLEALDIQRLIGDRQGEGRTLLGLGRAELGRGRPAQSSAALHAALEIFRALGETRLQTETEHLMLSIITDS